MQANFLPNLTFGDKGVSVTRPVGKKASDATMVRGLEAFLQAPKEILPPIGRIPVGTVDTKWSAIIATQKDTFQKGVQANLEGVKIRDIEGQPPNIDFAKKPINAIANLARAISNKVISVAEGGSVSRIKVPDLAKLAKKVR